MNQLHLFEPDQVNVNGLMSSDGVWEFWGIARRKPNGKYACYALCYEAICIVEVIITFVEGGNETEVHRLPET